jgi:hypothetical protein
MPKFGFFCQNLEIFSPKMAPSHKITKIALCYQNTATLCG